MGLLGVVISIFYLNSRIASTSSEIVDEEAPPSAPTPEMPGEPPTSHPLWTAPGPAPTPTTSSPQPYTNEDLQAFLEEDKRRLGIKKIFTKEELRQQAQAQPPQLDPERAREAEAARERIRFMAEELRKANEARKKQPIAIDGDKPALLSRPEDSYAARGTPTSVAGSPLPDSVDSTLGGRPPRLLAETPQDESRVLRSQQDLDRLWDDMKSARPKPRIDFEKQMVVAVVADRDSGRGVMISRIKRTSKKVMVEYRDAYPDDNGTYYEIQAIDRTDAPVAFQKVTPLSTQSQ